MNSEGSASAAVPTVVEPSGFRLVGEALETFLERGALSRAQRRWLDAFADGAAPTGLPQPSEADALSNLRFMLERMAVALTSMSEGLVARASCAVEAAFAWDVPRNAFTDRCRRFGMRVADAAQDDRLREDLGGRWSVRGPLGRFGELGLSEGTAGLLGRGAAPWLDVMLDALDAEARPVAAARDTPESDANGARSYRSTSPNEGRGYPSPSEILFILNVEPYQGELVIQSGWLRNHTAGARLERPGEGERTWADLELALPEEATDAREATRRLLADGDLRVRMVLGDGEWFEFDARDGTLRIEDAPSGRFSIALPAGWLERDVALGAVLEAAVEVVVLPNRMVAGEGDPAGEPETAAGE